MFKELFTESDIQKDIQKVLNKERYAFVSLKKKKGQHTIEDVDSNVAYAVDEKTERTYDIPLSDIERVLP